MQVPLRLPSSRYGDNRTEGTALFLAAKGSPYKVGSRMEELSLAELSQKVAKLKPCEYAGMSDHVKVCYSHRDFTDPARLWELEGECQRAGGVFGVIGTDYCYIPKNGPMLTEPATPEGRVMLVLRAWLAMNP